MSSGSWFVFPPCPQFVLASAAAVIEADKVVPVARAASVQELLALARGGVIEKPSELTPTRPSLWPLATQPPDISVRDSVTRGLAVTQCHEIVAVAPASPEFELSAGPRSQLIIPSLYT